MKKKRKIGYWFIKYGDKGIRYEGEKPEVIEMNEPTVCGNLSTITKEQCHQ